MLIKAGATSRSVDLFFSNSSSTTGAGLPGLAYNSAGLTCYYRKGATGTLTAVTLATQTVGGAYSSGGFVKIDDTNAPGLCRFDIPNAAIDTAGFSTFYFQGAANMAPLVLRIQCVAFDPEDTVRLGLTALPNVAAGANGGLPTGNGSGQVTVGGYASGQVPLQPTTAGRTLDVSATGEAGIDWANIGSPTTTVNLSGTTIGTVTALASTALAAIWDRATSALTTVGSIGKLIVDNLNATISSRQATLTATENNAIADALLTRSFATVDPSVSNTGRNALNALRRLRNMNDATSGTTLKIKGEDDTTDAWTATITSDATADPITKIDPA
jgi:hypothetical protein